MSFKTDKPEVCEWTHKNYVYVEDKGKAIPAMAQSLWPIYYKTVKGELEASGLKVVTSAALYSCGEAEGLETVYRAGAFVGEKPATVPKGAKYEDFPAAKRYCKFTILGSVIHLGGMTQKAVKYLEDRKDEYRLDDHGLIIENYVSHSADPMSDDFVTEVLFPLIN